MTPTTAEPTDVVESPETHTWTLRGVEFEDAAVTRCFECLTCAAVRYE